MKVLLIISDGFEDLEAFTAVSILRKANIPVIIASLSSTVVTSISRVKITADKRIGEISTNDYDILLLPSFYGAENSQKLINLIKDFNKENKLIVAMTKTPLILAKAGILENKIATVYAGLESKIPRPRDARIVIDGNIITSRSASDSLELALKLVETLQGKEAAKRLREEVS